MLRFRSRFHGFPRSSQPGFPCLLPRFSYSALCLFPFILPGFAPTAVPPVLPFFSASLRPLLSGLFCSPSAFFRLLPLASDYSAFCPFFSPLPVFPWQRFQRCAPVPCVPFAFLFCPACFHAFLPIPVLSFLRFLSPLFCFVSQALRSFWPPVSSSAIPLCFRFRFRLLGLSVWTFQLRIELVYITTQGSFCQHLFFIFFDYCLTFCDQLFSII